MVSSDYRCVPPIPASHSWETLALGCSLCFLPMNSVLPLCGRLQPLSGVTDTTQEGRGKHWKACLGAMSDFLFWGPLLHPRGYDCPFTAASCTCVCGSGTLHWGVPHAGWLKHFFPHVTGVLGTGSLCRQARPLLGCEGKALSGLL